jgi:hypothetical protein
VKIKKITLTPPLVSYMVTTPNTHHLNGDTNKKKENVKQCPCDTS